MSVSLMHCVSIYDSSSIPFINDSLYIFYITFIYFKSCPPTHVRSDIMKLSRPLLVLSFLFHDYCSTDSAASSQFSRTLRYLTDIRSTHLFDRVLDRFIRTQLISFAHIDIAPCTTRRTLL